MTQHVATSGQKAGRREWIGLAMLALPALLISMDMTVLHLAVPSLTADLRPTSSELLWIVDIYGFLIAGFLVTMGTLGDRIGRRRLLLIGAAAFGAASLLAAFSTSAEMLILARAMLGIAGATLAPSTLALIRNMFHEPRQRTMAISLWFMTFLAGAAAGPLIGGLLLELFWWGSVFLLGVPVMVLLLLTGPILLPEYRAPEAGRLDLPSAVLSLLAVLAVIFGLKQLAVDGFTVSSALVILAGLALGVVFAHRQRKLDTPLIDLGLFSERVFSVSLGGLTAAALVMMGVNYLVSQYLQLVVGLSPLEAGVWMLLPLVVGLVSMTLAPMIVRRIRPGFVISAGLAVAAAGFAVLSQVGGLTQIVVGLTISFAGLMPVSALGADVIMSAAPPERAGAASAISETTQELGGAMGIAILGSLATALYRGDMADAVPAGVPAEAAQAARDTLSGATGAAGRLPQTVLTAAEAAYTTGLQVAAGVSAAALAGVAVAAAIVLRAVRAGSAPIPDPVATVSAVPAP